WSSTCRRRWRWPTTSTSCPGGGSCSPVSPSSSTARISSPATSAISSARRPDRAGRVPGRALAGGAFGQEPVDVGGRDAPVGQRLGGVLAGPRRRAADGRRGAAEAGGGGRLEDAAVLHEHAPGPVVRVVGRLGPRQHRAEAQARVADEGFPLRPRPAGEGGGEGRPHLGPVDRVERIAEVAVEAEHADQRLEEVRLAGRHRHVAPVGRLVDVVPRRRPVEAVVLPLVVEFAEVALAVHERRQQRRAVHHGGVDHLALAGPTRLEQGAQDPDEAEHPAAPVVADQVEGRGRRRAAPAEGVEDAGHGDVVDVVARGGGIRAVLAPARGPGVDQAGVAGQADVGPEADALGHPRPPPLDEHVGAGHQSEHGVEAGGGAQVDGHRTGVAAQQEIRRPALVVHPARPVEAHDVGAEVAEDHGGERRRPDPAEVENPRSGQRPAARGVHRGPPAVQDVIVRVPKIPLRGPLAHPTVDEFAEECRAFLDAHARPRPRPAAGPFVWGAGDDRVVLFDEEDREEIEAARAWRALRHKAGLDWISGPEEYGGRGLPPAYERIYADREAAYDVPDQSFFKIGLGIIAPTLLAHAGETVKRRYLPSMFSGERLACQLFSEPAAGSDLASLTTRAVRDGDGWVVSGQKVWTSGAHLCDLGELLARTDPAAPKHKGISAFLVDLHAPGVEVRPLRQMTGGSSFNEVFLDEVRVPDDHRLAGVNE